MRAGAQARTIFAGLGVTGCLIGGIGAVFAIAGGVLAFQGWPDAPASPANRALEVAAAARTVAPPAARALQLAVSAPPVFAGRTAPTSARHGARHGHESRTGATVHTVPVAAAPPRPAHASPAPAATPAPSGTLATTGRAAVGATSHAIRSAGTLVPPAAPVTDLLADTVDRVGRLVWPGN